MVSKTGAANLVDDILPVQDQWEADPRLRTPSPDDLPRIELAAFCISPRLVKHVEL